MFTMMGKTEKIKFFEKPTVNKFHIESLLHMFEWKHRKGLWIRQQFYLLSNWTFTLLFWQS